MARDVVNVPLSALLPPQANVAAPTEIFPRLAALLGPMPPSAPLNVACAFLSLMDLKPFHQATKEPKESGDTSGGDTAGATAADNTDDPRAKAVQHALALLPPAPARVLVITGPRAAWHADLEEEDATYLRHMDVRVRDALRRTDVRYCPSPEHLRLITAVLSAGSGAAPNEVSPPALIVLYNTLDLLFTERETDENRPGAGDSDAGAARELADSATLANYLDAIAATLSAARYFADGADPIPVLILEPNGDVPLPILAGTGEGAPVPPAQRRRKVQVSDALRHLGFSVSSVKPLPSGEPKHTKSGLTPDPMATQEEFDVLFNDSVVRRARRQPGTKAEFACPPREAGEPPESGGWEWTWV